MVARSIAVGLVVLIASHVMHLVAGFGYLSFPPATYRDVKRSQFYTAEINSSIHPTFFGLRHIDTKRAELGERRASVFVNQLAFADFLSLRELVDAVFPGCGNSMIDTNIEPVNVYNAKYVMWRNEEEKVGFYPKGLGPCETWIDNRRVQFHGNCVRAYPTYPAKIPINFRHCRRGQVCELRFYWIAVATTPFKLMKHCVRIVNDPYRMVGKENTKPLKSPTTSSNSELSIDLAITWEKVWLYEDDECDQQGPNNLGSAIRVIP